MRINELHNQPVKPDTYEASMAQNQLLKIGTHSIQLHNLIKDEQEMESWVAKKIDLASNYVKSVHGYMAGSKAGAYDDNGMTENKINETYVRVKSVYDGDTITIIFLLNDKLTCYNCRIQGVDTPEKKIKKSQPDRGREKFYAIKARDFVSPFKAALEAT